jgi:hypothetical protein
MAQPQSEKYNEKLFYFEKLGLYSIFGETVYLQRTSLKYEGLWRLIISLSYQALLTTNKFLLGTVVMSDMRNQ